MNAANPLYRYLEQCEAIRDREHTTLPPLTPEQLESKAERFTGVFTQPRGTDHGRRRRGRHEDGTDGGENQVRMAPTVGANASLATRMGRCRTATTSDSGDEDVDGDDSTERETYAGSKGEDPRAQQPRRENEDHERFALEASAEMPLGNTNNSATTSTEFLANATLVSSLSSWASRASGGKGITARIAAAQKQASSNTTTSASISMSDNSHAKPAARNASSHESIPPPFQGRSLMSAAWISKRGAGAAGRRGQPRYATKGLTPGSWTATEDPTSEAGMGATGGHGVGGGSGGSDGCVGSASRAGCLSSQHAGSAAATNKRIGGRGGVNKRGLGREWEGLYQVRLFEDTPE